jgi:pSer/pThr/pTyr-binding forkhead associated (FHA) protein
VRAEKDYFCEAVKGLTGLRPSELSGFLDPASPSATPRREGVAMASIIVLTGKQKDDYYPLGHRTNVIGRDEALPVQILDKKVSRKHMKIRYDADKDKYYAVDMNSKHGVFINSEKLDKEAELAEGDYITIGNTSLFFTLKDFTDRESALSHFKKVGERINTTLDD